MLNPSAIVLSVSKIKLKSRLKLSKLFQIQLSPHLTVPSQRANLESLMGFLKEKDFTNMRQWVVDNINTDPVFIYRQIYDEMYKYLQPQSVPQVVLLIAEYQYKQAFVQDVEINLVAFLTEVMVEAEWK